MDRTKGASTLENLEENDRLVVVEAHPIHQLAIQEAHKTIPSCPQQFKLVFF